MTSFASPYPLFLHLKTKNDVRILLYLFLVANNYQARKLIVQFFSNGDLIVQFSDQYLLYRSFKKKHQMSPISQGSPIS